MLAQARRRAEELGRPVTLREADAQALPFGDASFDTVVCTLSLCAIPDDRRAVAEMIRVLRPGGRLLLLDQLADQPHTTLAARAQPGYLFPGRPATRPISRAALVQRLNRHGLRVRPARNTALITLADDLPAAVLADLLGLHPNTAVGWTRYAGREWAAYLASRSAT